MQTSITIIDYGSGNIRSVFNALKKVADQDTRVSISDAKNEIEDAHLLVLPGVGSFQSCMQRLGDMDFVSLLEARVKAGIPVLGICVGMQVLATFGTEPKTTRGLDFIKGEVRQLEVSNSTDKLRLPHVGWEKLNRERESFLFEGINAEAPFYFVHSYGFWPSSEIDLLATCTYGTRFAAAIQCQNVVGVQFHPEKASFAGLRFLYNFSRWNKYQKQRQTE